MHYRTAFVYTISKCAITNGHLILEAIIGTTNSAPYHSIKSLQYIWGSGTRSSNELQGLNTDEGARM